MKLTLVLAAMVAAAVARPQQPAAGVIPILDYQESRDEFGQYALSYLTGDGTKVTEQGELVPNEKGDGHVLIKKGTYTYYAPDGTEITESWSADDKGFTATGNHLPVPPAPIEAASL